MWCKMLWGEMNAGEMILNLIIKSTISLDMVRMSRGNVPEYLPSQNNLGSVLIFDVRS